MTSIILVSYGLRDTTNNTTNWNVTDPSYVKINKAYEVSLGESEIISSDLELPYDYSGSESNKRIVYAAYSSNTICDDVYLIKDALVKRLDVKDGDKVPIASITYEGTCGEGELLAGLAAPPHHTSTPAGRPAGTLLWKHAAR